MWCPRRGGTATASSASSAFATSDVEQPTGRPGSSRAIPSASRSVRGTAPDIRTPSGP
ncbi:MAG TPA: hypothetical protein VE546_14405 [Streptomyces sp.]|uniref:hypothetical protein n=1 Tax=Streptomyces sp. TaxID=1931 RepID=UPI002D53948D|nr:hypothetical protein [Streptomyces sp.]HZG04741.1 hypothetical protein [Streptomyces sp.]